ncbi:MAG: alkaline phosphatase D family protein [Betaproteobacteria bacterium]
MNLRPWNSPGDPTPDAPFDRGRRRVLLASVAAAALAAPTIRLRAAQGFASYPFGLGVASGCPRPDGFVLWTRLAPDPLQGGGMPPAPVEVDWQVAEDESFMRIAGKGIATATSELAHSVHVDVQGLRPERDYWYRFHSGAATSPVGRTRTAPAAGVSPANFRFAFASCQQYEQGYYAAYRDMASQKLDLVVHLGDYIYESSWGVNHVRHHTGAIPTTLPEYRERYALYKSDRDLQAAHAAFPWLVIWDDHEVANDYTNDRSPRTQDPAQFLAMRAAAYQAWYEHMPVPSSARPRGPNATIYGRYRFGDLLDVMLLDGRQYRSHHACLPGKSASPLADCPDRSAPLRSMLGQQQETWFAQQMRSAPAHWSVVAQTTLMAEADRKAGNEHGYWMDGWDGYTASRKRLLDALATQPNNNALVVSGDVHAFWAADLRQDFSAARSPVIATEFVGGAITSQGPSAANLGNALAKNPHLRYGRGDKRGYALMTLERKRCGVEFRAVDDEKDPASAVRTLARFGVDSGAPGVQMERSP